MKYRMIHEAVGINDERGHALRIYKEGEVIRVESDWQNRLCKNFLARGVCVVDETPDPKRVPKAPKKAVIYRTKASTSEEYENKSLDDETIDNKETTEKKPKKKKPDK